MTRSCIICEGQTDFVLLQYLMEKVYGWEDRPAEFKSASCFKATENKTRSFFKGDGILTITETGGVPGIINRLVDLIKYNVSVTNEGLYSKIVIFTDNDEAGTKEEWRHKIKEKLEEKGGLLKEVNNDEFECKMTNSSDSEIEFFVYLVVIPSGEYGAIESFLLTSLKQKDEYDGKIIDKVDTFVDHIDEEKRYLSHRCLYEKAKFDVYFSIRTPREAFGQRRDILRDVPWEKYVDMRNELAVFGEL